MLHGFSLQEGYKKALHHDIDTKLNQTTLDTVKYDQDIADSQLLPVVDVSAKIGQGRNSADESKSYNEDQYGVKVTQPLFDGFKYSYESKIQKEKFNYSKNILLDSKNVLANEYVKTYIDMLKQRELLRLRMEAVQKSENIFNKVFKKVQSGYGKKIEFEEAKDRYTKTKVDLSIQKINYKTALENLKYYVQEEFDSNELIKPNFYYILPNSLESALALAKDINPLYLSTKSDLLISEFERKRDLKNFYPSLSLVGSYDKYDSISSDTKNDPFSESKIGLELYYNLYNGGKDVAEDKKSLQNMHKKKLLVEKNENKLDNKVRLAWNNYKMTIDKLEKQESYTQAKKDLLDVTIQEFELGLKGLTSLLDERQEYISAQVELVSASYENLLSKYQLLASIGNLAIVIETQSLSMEDRFSKTLETKEDISIEDLLNENIQKTKMVKRVEEKKETIVPPKTPPQPKDFDLLKPKKKESNLDINQSTSSVVAPKISITPQVEETKKKTIVVVKSFKDRFLTAPKDYYTINLAYAKKDSTAQNLIDKNNFQKSAFYFRFGNELQHIKVMLGVFKTKAEAYEVLSNLVDTLKRLQPRVESVELKQKLYRKYNSSKQSVEKSEKEIEKPAPKKEENIVFKNFKEYFLKAPKEYYTINLAYAQKESTARYIIDNYNLSDKAFYFQFGDQLQHIKIMLGVFKTQDEAYEVLSKLDDKLKAFQPRVEPIKIKQKLYRKYNLQDNNGSL